ncbi:MAG: oligopeptide/dipeptide ABC transporter ATP-binding protein, partial [Chloroflexota bacterium]
AIPVPDPIQERKRTRVILKGDVPSPVNPPSGCRFNPRCRYAEGNCATDEPELIQVDAQHTVACHYWQEIEQGTKRVINADVVATAA